MRGFAKVRPDIWLDRRLTALPDDVRLLHLYCWTSPHSTAAGAYFLPIGYIATDLTWTTRRVADGLDALSSAELISWHDDWIRILDWWRTNVISNRNQAVHIRDLMDAMPPPIRRAVADDLAVTENRFARDIGIVGEPRLIRAG